MVLNEIIGKVKNGELGGEAFAATLANGGLKMDFNADFELPAEVKTLADQTVQGIIAGSIVVGEVPPPQVEPPPTEGPVFGLVLVGPKNDHGWSQAHFEGGQYVEQNLPGSRRISRKPPWKALWMTWSLMAQR